MVVASIVGCSRQLCYNPVQYYDNSTMMVYNAMTKNVVDGGSSYFGMLILVSNLIYDY